MIEVRLYEYMQDLYNCGRLLHYAGETVIQVKDHVGAWRDLDVVLEKICKTR